MSDSVSTDGGAPPPGTRIESLGVAFFDCARFDEWSSSEDDARIAGFLVKFYELAASRIEPAGGRIVKVMGDAGLAVCPADALEGLIFALSELATEVRQCAARDFGLDTHLAVNVHVGPVIAGEFGPPGAERFDVIGKTVNVAARLGRRGVTLSAQAFRCLSSEGRTRFRKYMRPITYHLRG